MDRISLSSTVSGLVIGTFVLCANFQFGLQTGWVSMMSMPAALLGFAWFKTLRQQLTAQENVYIQSVAVAVGTGPLSFGLVGAIPAIELLLTDEEGRTLFTVPQLMLWSLGIGFIGIFTALLLREMIISDRNLTFPSGSAAAALIGVLHDKPIERDSVNLTEQDQLRDSESRVGSEAPAGSEARVESDESEERRHDYEDSQDIEFSNEAASIHSGIFRPDTMTMSPDHHMDSAEPAYRRNIIVLVTMFMLSSIYTLLSKLLWFLRAIPLFGSGPARYMWKFELSPAYIGQGIVMGLPTTLAMMLGAVMGWAILAPLATHMGWATGPIDDWQTGAQGWIMWVSLAIMVADTGVSFVLLTFNSLRVFVRQGVEYRRLKEARNAASASADGRESASSVDSAGSSSSGLHDVADSEESGPRLLNVPLDIESPASQWKLASVGMVASSVLCIVCVNLLFGSVPTLALTIAVAISPLLSLLGVRALGETDLNPVSSIAKLTQFVFGIMMHSQPHSVLLNIVAGAITEAGAQQAGDLMQDYKTGGLMGAMMTHQTIGMIVGTMWSVVVSGFVFKLYNTRFTIPGPEFRIPTAYIWADCARLMTGEGISSDAGPFAIGLALIFTVIAVIKQVICKHKPWAKWLPSGVAVGIGMYNVPSFTIARFLGGLIAFWYQRRCRRPADEVYLVILSSGLILGEGIMSVVYLLASI